MEAGTGKPARTGDPYKTQRITSKQFVLEIKKHHDNKRINMKNESIVPGFTVQKTKQKVPLSLAFKFRHEGQLKL